MPAVACSTPPRVLIGSVYSTKWSISDMGMVVSPQNHCWLVSTSAMTVRDRWANSFFIQRYPPRLTTPCSLGGETFITKQSMFTWGPLACRSALFMKEPQ